MEHTITTLCTSRDWAENGSKMNQSFLSGALHNNSSVPRPYSHADLPDELLRIVMVYVVYTRDNILSHEEQQYNISDSEEFQAMNEMKQRILLSDYLLHRSRFEEKKHLNLIQAISSLAFVSKRMYSIVPTIVTPELLLSLLKWNFNRRRANKLDRNQSRDGARNELPSHVNDSLLDFFLPHVDIPFTMLMHLPITVPPWLNFQTRVTATNIVSPAAMQRLVSQCASQVHAMIKYYHLALQLPHVPSNASELDVELRAEADVHSDLRNNSQLLLEGIHSLQRLASFVSTLRAWHEVPPEISDAPHEALLALHIERKIDNQSPELEELSAPSLLSELKQIVDSWGAQIFDVFMYTSREDLFVQFLDTSIVGLFIPLANAFEYPSSASPLFFALRCKNYTLFRRIRAMAHHLFDNLFDLMLPAIAKLHLEHDNEFYKLLREYFPEETPDYPNPDYLLDFFTALFDYDILSAGVHFYLDHEDAFRASRILHIMIEALKESSPGVHNMGTQSASFSNFLVSVSPTYISTLAWKYGPVIELYVAVLTRDAMSDETVAFFDRYYPYVYFHCAPTKLLPLFSSSSLATLDFAMKKLYEEGILSKLQSLTLREIRAAIDDTRFYIPDREPLRVHGAPYYEFPDSFRWQKPEAKWSNVTDRPELQRGYEFPSCIKDLLDLFVSCSDEGQLAILTHYFGRFFVSRSQRFVMTLFQILFESFLRLRAPNGGIFEDDDALNIQRTRVLLDFYDPLIDEMTSHYILLEAACCTSPRPAIVRLLLTQTKFSTLVNRRRVLQALLDRLFQNARPMLESVFAETIEALIDTPELEEELFSPNFSHADESQNVVTADQIQALSNLLIPIDLENGCTHYNEVLASHPHMCAFKEQFFNTDYYREYNYFVSRLENKSNFVKMLVFLRMFSVVRKYFE